MADGSVLVYPPLRARRCGVAGGARTNMSFRAGGFGPETGYPQGFNGSQLPPIPKEQRRTWKLGSTASVSWVSVANHAGGYTYSLCPADEELTEEASTGFLCSLSTTRRRFATCSWKRAVRLDRTALK